MGSARLVDAWGRVDDVVGQAGGAVHLGGDGLGEGLGGKLRAGGAGVGVVVGVEGVGAAVAELLIGEGLGVVVVDVGDAAAGDGGGGGLDVADEAGRGVGPAARLPLVVGRLRAQHDGRALGHHLLGRLADVVDKGVDGRAVLAGLARLGARAGAVAAPVVVGLGAAAVVVAELDHHDVARLDQVGHFGEAALDRVGAGRPAADGLVDDGGGGELAKVLAPAVGCAVVGAVLGHGAVTAQVDGWRRPLDDLCRGGRRGGDGAQCDGDGG